MAKKKFDIDQGFHQLDEILTKQDEPLDTQSIFPDEPYGW